MYIGHTAAFVLQFCELIPRLSLTFSVPERKRDDDNYKIAVVSSKNASTYHLLSLRRIYNQARACKQW